jgi:EAL domain-containing protein (putative c-di-GMP-specific phosphodiesterase class I)/CHASE3 domain sensor protein
VTSLNRVVALVGSAAIIASVAIAAVFIQTNAADAQIQLDQADAREIQTLGDQLLAQVQEQRVALDEYLLSADSTSLAGFQQAVTSEASTAQQISAGAGDLSGIPAALADVGAANAAWRLTVADPAIAAVQSGSRAAVNAAIQAALQDQEATQAAASQFIVKIDALAAQLGAPDSLNWLGAAATALGLAIELLAAGLSLWYVRRYGLTVARDTQRRERVSAERIEIVASLRTLRMGATPELTGATIAEALHGLPGVDVAGVLQCTADGLAALAIVGLPGFPIQTGDAVPEDRARYLRARSGGGPWGERWVGPARPSAYDERLTALGIESQAYAPIQAGGELIGLIAMATTNADHGRHLVEDLPAIGEFASVAETLLAPALVARRDREDQRRRIGATIASAAFQPVFQPIIALLSGEAVGFEALTRFDDGARPDHVFAAALECGLGIALETVTLSAAIREAHLLPPGAWLSLNVSPALLAEEGTLATLLAHASRPIVLEVTEHEAIVAYGPLREAMRVLGPGVRLAVDDAGAGVANFNHLVELRPNFVKIDISLVRGVDTDPSRRALVVGLVHFAVEAGCEVLAEGIETEAERATVIELGVTLGQGYLLAKPAPASSWQMVPGRGAVPKRGVRPTAHSRLPVALPIPQLPGVSIHLGVIGPGLAKMASQQGTASPSTGHRHGAMVRSRRRVPLHNEAEQCALAISTSAPPSWLSEPDVAS